MTKKQVWQYKCDFCGKKNYSGGHMRDHEKHCTANPDRICRFHKHCENQVQPPMPEIIKALREVGLDAAKEVTSDCPVCILAGLRQSGLGKGYLCEETGNYTPPKIEYNFKSEMADKWKEIDYALEIAREYV